MAAVLNGPWRSPAGQLIVVLCWAAQHGFFDRVKLLVEKGVDVNGRSGRTARTAYEEALRAGRQRIAEYLLEHGARRTELDPLETFARACIAGNRDEVRARLAADPSLMERLGFERQIDMLHRAAGAHNADAVRLIVELGVDINGMVRGTGFDRTVLHNAAAWNTLGVVKLLVELGADPILRDQTYHGTAIGWALYNGNRREVVDYLLQFATIFDAVQAGAVERAASLLHDDPGLVGARDGRGNPLAFSLYPELPGLTEMIALLVAQGVDLNAKDADGKTLVDHSRAHGLTGFAGLLRTYGARESAEEGS